MGFSSDSSNFAMHRSTAKLRTMFQCSPVVLVIEVVVIAVVVVVVRFVGLSSCRRCRLQCSPPPCMQRRAETASPIHVCARAPDRAMIRILKGSPLEIKSRTVCRPVNRLEVFDKQLSTARIEALPI
eukprot:gnl/TRDRNA2_/TRDRNA2_177110_c0_seq3.p1 gnl/TRDRNA2_/TRDRNA2_177110_c0~~gnl/TRDRNA2_/TRDRNA2_177110_c0_seq3.p1  ORF type:complete len:127 (+),score=4.29 gnl/TRDRNA2_/TRDRNA2_177110_c0_seq3:399-779(+)